MFLQTLSGARILLGAAAWATCTLLGSRTDNRFPLTVKVHTGEEVIMSVVRPLSNAPPALAIFQSLQSCLPSGQA